MTVKQNLQTEIRDLTAKLSAATDRIEALEKALGHYADGMNWNHLGVLRSDEFGQLGDSLYTFGGSHQNGYDIARAALTPVKEDEKSVKKLSVLRR